MLELWSAQSRHALWRRLWLALAEAEQNLGVAIPDEAIRQMRAHLDDIDFGQVAEFERRFRHDVMAHVHAFGAVAPAARPFIHLGATSAYVTDNTDLILMRRSLELLRPKIVGILRSLAEFAARWRDLPTLELFGGDHEKVRELERRVVKAMGFEHALAVTGQTYSRKLDAQLLSVVSGLAASAAKFSADVRLLQSFGEIEEPFEAEQIGSSAMAYKRNPMRSERIASLARFVITLEENANHTHSVQFFERTLDDSANRRLVLPESFLATDAILILMSNVAAGLEVHPARIAQRVAAELPFMATEALIVRAVQLGGDRQTAHETIRRHAIEAARAVKDGASTNDLLVRLAGDAAWPLDAGTMSATASAERFVGRAPQQVDDFLAEVIQPVLLGASAETVVEELRV
jgi:adenylosuccinate lyase